LQREIKAPILDLREELKKKLVGDNVKTVTVLGAPSTVREGLYEFEGLKYLNPSAGGMEQLADAILSFNRGFEEDEQRDTVRRICRKYLQKGSEVVVLGCTEFAVMLEGEDLPTINTVNVLVESTVDRVRREKSI
jgi:aspartate racemase